MNSLCIRRHVGTYSTYSSIIISTLIQADGILNRIHVAEPAKRDDKPRPPCIPEAVLKRRMRKMKMEDDEDEEDEEDMDTGEEKKTYFK